MSESKITNSELENICNFIKPSAILISDMSQKYSIKAYQFLDLSDLEDDMSNQSEPIKINNNSDALILLHLAQLVRQKVLFIHMQV